MCIYMCIHICVCITSRTFSERIMYVQFPFSNTHFKCHYSILNLQKHLEKQPPECSVKKVFLKILQFSQKAVSFQVCNVIKKRLQHRCFLVKCANFLRTPILKNICERLLLYLFKEVAEWSGWNMHDWVFFTRFAWFCKIWISKLFNLTKI